MKDKNEDRLVKVINGDTGSDEGELVLEWPPNFAGVEGLNRAGKLLYVEGRDDRTAVYSLETGKQVRQMFGVVRAVDTSTGRVCTANRTGEAAVFDAKGLELAHYELDSPIRYMSFRAGANLVSVLTADQKVRVLRVGSDADPGK